MESQNSSEGNHFTFYAFCTMNRQSPCVRKEATIIGSSMNRQLLHASFLRPENGIGHFYA